LCEEVVRLKLDAARDGLLEHFKGAGYDAYFAEMLTLRAMSRVDVTAAGNVIARTLTGEAITGTEPFATLAEDVMTGVPAEHRPRGAPASNMRSSPGAAYFDGIREQVRAQQERARSSSFR
jgi:hypothetical protein